MENKILVLDIETTGFLPKGKIVEIGIIELDINDGSKVILFDQIVRESTLTEEEVVNSWIVTNGYMKVDDILNGQLLEEVIPCIQEIIDRYQNGATAFNNRFDFDFLEARGIKIFKKLPCPMILSTNICKIQGKYGNKWPKVEEAYSYFFGETGYVEQHRGADDAFHEADIVFELIKRGVFKI